MCPAAAQPTSLLHGTSAVSNSGQLHPVNTCSKPANRTSLASSACLATYHRMPNKRQLKKRCPRRICPFASHVTLYRHFVERSATKSRRKIPATGDPVFPETCTSKEFSRKAAITCKISLESSFIQSVCPCCVTSSSCEDYPRVDPRTAIQHTTLTSPKISLRSKWINGNKPLRFSDVICDRI
jgi:hypothetical protein